MVFLCSRVENKEGSWGPGGFVYPGIWEKVIFAQKKKCGGGGGGGREAHFMSHSVSMETAAYTTLLNDP